MMRFLLSLAWLLTVLGRGGPLLAQAPGVPIHDDEAFLAEAIKSCEKKHALGELTAVDALAPQLRRSECTLTLPPARAGRKLAGEDVWRQAQSSCIRVGTFYLCRHCKHWHLNVAGGYAITADGAVATCRHVIEPSKEMREAYLVALDPAGNVCPVTEILASCPQADVAILQVAGAKFTPLPLNINTKPGQRIYCLSAPKMRFDFFTEGIISRFFIEPRQQRESRYASSSQISEQTAFPDKRAAFMAVTLDFASGSSGSPILDEFGNAVGHVQSTLPLFSDENKKSAESLQLIQHQASTAREVLALIHPTHPSDKDRAPPAQTDDPTAAPKPGASSATE